MNLKAKWNRLKCRWGYHSKNRLTATEVNPSPMVLTYKTVSVNEGEIVQQVYVTRSGRTRDYICMTCGQLVDYEMIDVTDHVDRKYFPSEWPSGMYEVEWKPE
jgi:hypothetical protein